MKKLFLSLIVGLGLSSLSFANSDIPFTLRNNSLKSIFLKIPGVMNPNLSPQSNSGVDLTEGQKIFFFHKNKKYLLLEVDKSFEGKIINVDKLLKERKKELNLKYNSKKDKKSSKML